MSDKFFNAAFGLVGAKELLKYAEPIVSLDKMMVDMANKNLPASNNCHDIIANSDRVSDKENTRTDDPAPLKILSITSLTTTTAVKEEPKNGNSWKFKRN